MAEAPDISHGSQEPGKSGRSLILVDDFAGEQLTSVCRTPEAGCPEGPGVGLPGAAVWEQQFESRFVPLLLHPCYAHLHFLVLRAWWSSRIQFCGHISAVGYESAHAFQARNCGVTGAPQACSPYCSGLAGATWLAGWHVDLWAGTDPQQPASL